MRRVGATKGLPLGRGQTERSRGVSPAKKNTSKSQHLPPPQRPYTQLLLAPLSHYCASSPPPLPLNNQQPLNSAVSAPRMEDHPSVGPSGAPRRRAKRPLKASAEVATRPRRTCPALPLAVWSNVAVKSETLAGAWALTATCRPWREIGSEGGCSWTAAGVARTSKVAGGLRAHGAGCVRCQARQVDRRGVHGVRFSRPCCSLWAAGSGRYEGGTSLTHAGRRPGHLPCLPLVP